MRSFVSVLTGMLLVGSMQAQQSAPPPANAPSPLDQHLARWEREMQSIATLTAEMHRTTVDKTWGTTEQFVGTAKYQKPNLAVLEMRKKDNPQIFEKYLCTGNYLYQYVPGSKVINVYELPPRSHQTPGDDNFLSFLFGMKAAEARQRYDLKLVKEDQWYVYIEILPRLPVDKQDFQRARLVLNRSNFLPRQVWFEQPNGNEITWDIPRAQRDVALDRSEFAPPTQAPPGWSMVRVPRAEAAPANDVKPTVVRPSGQ